MVLIENMDKPKSCDLCPLCDDADGDCLVVPDSEQKDTCVEQYANCPLKEVQS